MAASPKVHITSSSKRSAATSSKSKAWPILFGLLVGLSLVALVGGIVFFIKYENDSKKQKNKKENDVCEHDSDCASACGGRAGCCAKCRGNRCTTGVITASGCQLNPSSTQPKDGSSNMVQNPSPADDYRKYSNNMMGSLGTIGHIGQPECVSNDDAQKQVCLGSNSPTCCGVCYSGKIWKGELTDDGVCHTTVAQTGYSGMGMDPPNTYVVTSSGPNYGATMGACHVSPVGSSLANHVGINSPIDNMYL